MNHREFMGVPFEGTAKTFFSKIKSSAKIYSVEKESDEEVNCQLSFTGKWASVKIYGNPVSLVSVELHYGYGIKDPTVEEWKQMVDDYYDYKAALSKKYGSPSISRQVTTYNGDVIDNRKNLTFDELSWGAGAPKCYSSYKTRTGDITLSTIIKGAFRSNFNGLEINYWDTYNKEHPFKPEDNRFNDL